jgi:hypothetical protein
MGIHPREVRMKVSRKIELTLSDVNKWRAWMDLGADNATELSTFMSYWLNDKLGIALDSGELKDEFSMWRDAAKD